METTDIRLSVTARDRLRRELRNSPVVREHVREPASIVRMTKEELLALAEKCGIDVLRIVEDERERGKGIESVLTPEEFDLWNYSAKHPAFTGVLQLPIKFEVAGKASERLLRVKYECTPEWEYFDLHKKQVMKGWACLSTKYEIRTQPGKGYVDQRSKWINAALFGDIGVLSIDQDDTLEQLIEEQCKQEDRKRRNAAGLTKAGRSKGQH